jgi:hypothetical protein
MKTHREKKYYEACKKYGMPAVKPNPFSLRQVKSIFANALKNLAKKRKATKSTLHK